MPFLFYQLKILKFHFLWILGIRKFKKENLMNQYTINDISAIYHEIKNDANYEFEKLYENGLMSNI